MSTLEELWQALGVVEQNLEQARGQLSQGHKALRETIAALAAMDPEHPESVVPSGLHRADDQIEHTLSRIEHVADALRSFANRL